MLSPAMNTDISCVFDGVGMDNIAQLQVELETAVPLVTAKLDPQLVQRDCTIMPSP